MTFDGNSLGGTQPQRDREIKLAWSERKQGGWTNKKVSSEVYECRWFPLSEYFFRWCVDDLSNNLSIIASSPGPMANISTWTEVAEFYFETCHGEPKTRGFYTEVLKDVTGTQFYFMYLQEDGDEQLYLPAPDATPALKRTPGTFSLLPHPDGASIAEHPFFYSDSTRTFFVIPSKVPPGPVPEGAVDIAGPVLVHYYEAPDPFPVRPGDPPPRAGGPVLFEPSFPVSSKRQSNGARARRAIRWGGTLPDAGTGSPRTLAHLGARTGALNSANAPRVGAAAGSNTAEEVGASWREYVSDVVLGNEGIAPPENRLGASPLPHLVTEYTFQTFYHPYVSAFVGELNRHGVDGLLQRDVQLSPARFVPRRRQPRSHGHWTSRKPTGRRT